MRRHTRCKPGPKSTPALANPNRPIYPILKDKLGLNYSFVASWITLTVHSSLEAVGLTAAFSKALAEKGISCNVVAAFYHDHLFVRQQDAAAAMETLKGLSA